MWAYFCIFNIIMTSALYGWRNYYANLLVFRQLVVVINRFFSFKIRPELHENLLWYCRLSLCEIIDIVKDSR